jgi:hypothetical protein
MKKARGLCTKSRVPKQRGKMHQHSHSHLGPSHQRRGKVSDGLGVQLRDCADLQEFAAGILILDGLQKLFVSKHMLV